MTKQSKDDGSTLFDEYEAIRKAPGLNASAKLMLWAIHSRAGNGKGECFASNLTLGADVGMEGADKSVERAVSRLVADLTAGGWIVDPDAGGGKSKYRRNRRLVIGPSLLSAPRQECRGSGGEHPDKSVSAPRQECPSTQTNPSLHPDKNVYPTTPETSPGTYSRNVAPSVGRSDGPEGATEGRSHAHSGGGEGNGQGERAWVEVWKALSPPKDEWFTWPADRAVAWRVALHVAKTAEHMKPAPELVKRKPATLTARGASWRAVAAAIVRTSERDPDSVRTLHSYVNALALEHHTAQPRPIEKHEHDIIVWAEECNRRERDFDATWWRREALPHALRQHVPEAAGAFAAIEALESDRFNRGLRGCSEYNVVEDFVQRVRDLSGVLDDGWWRRLADAAEDAVISGAIDLPTLDELLSRSQGGEYGHAEAAG